MKSFRIGRASDNHMSVASPHVSRYHAEFSYSTGVLEVSDLNSTGGTFLNGARVSRARVQIGDDLRLTMHCRFDWNSSAFRTWYNAVSVSSSPSVTEELIIGRGSSCDIVLSNPYTSKRHARLIRSSSGIELEDLGSRGGTMVSGSRITRKHVSFGDRVEFSGRERLDWNNPKLKPWETGNFSARSAQPAAFQREYAPKGLTPGVSPSQYRSRKSSTGLVLGTIAATLILAFGVLVPTGMISLEGRASSPQTPPTSSSTRSGSVSVPHAPAPRPEAQPSASTVTGSRSSNSSSGASTSASSGSSSGAGPRYGGHSSAGSGQGIVPSDVGVAIDYGMAAASGDVIGLVELELEHQGIQRVVNATAEAASDGRLGRNVQNATRAVENWSNEMTDRLIGW